MHGSNYAQQYVHKYTYIYIHTSTYTWFILYGLLIINPSGAGAVKELLVCVHIRRLLLYTVVVCW